MFNFIRSLGKFIPGHVSRTIGSLQSTRYVIEDEMSACEKRLSHLLFSEQEQMRNGKCATDTVVQQSIARSVMGLRRDIRRENSRIKMAWQQIEIIKSRLHNMSIMAQNKIMPLPNSEELVTEASIAEGELKELQNIADLANHIEVNNDPISYQEEESAILAEFKVANEKQLEIAPVEIEEFDVKTIRRPNARVESVGIADPI